MKTLICGNSGSGKTTLARRLARAEDAALLSLDELAFDAGTGRRPLESSIRDGLALLGRHRAVVVEGCYADIARGLAAELDRMVFLNPGIEACLANCRARPWEPEKYASRALQDARLEELLEWVSNYERRDDEYGLGAHRALFDAFAGAKVELRDPTRYIEGLEDAFGVQC